MKKTKSRPHYSVPCNILFLARDMAARFPLLIVFLLLEMVLSVVSPIIGLYIPKLAIDLVTRAAPVAQVFYSLGGIGLAMALAMALSGMAGQGKYMMYNNMRRYYHYKLFMQSLDCDYAHIETPEGQTRYSRAVGTIRGGDGSGTSRLTVAALDILIAAASFLIYSGILSTLNILVVVVLVLLSCVNYYAVSHAQNYEHRHKDAAATLDRQMNYVQHTANDSRWGKDIRLYGMSGWILAMRDGLLRQYTALNHKIRQRYFAAGAVNAFTLFLRDGLAYGYLIWAVSTDAITVGNFVLYFGAITGFSGFVGRIVGDVNALNSANLQMNDLRAFLDLTDSPDPEHPADPPSGKDLSIEFRRVCFTYAPDSEPVLKDFSLSIGAGEKVALVGVNGAGKTTLVKLLCGFYTPDSGDIFLDGIPIHRYRKKDLFALFSVVFQDIFIAPFTVAENVSMRLLPETDLDRVDDCLKQAGLFEAIARTPDKAHSYMLKAVVDGIVLSGGQQQKLLMARALYKNAPILILDEPTAALDPIAESETYAKFHQLARDKTSIYISHRLASTRFCDKVVLLHNGRVSESGTHEELIDRGGQYARMYAMQSHYYQSERGDQLA